MDANPCSQVKMLVTGGRIFLPSTAEVEQHLAASSSIKVSHASGSRSCISTNSRWRILVSRHCGSGMTPCPRYRPADAMTWAGVVGLGVYCVAVWRSTAGGLQGGQARRRNHRAGRWLSEGLRIHPTGYFFLSMMHQNEKYRNGKVALANN